MGRIQEMREESRSRVQIAMSTAALAPLLEQIVATREALTQQTRIMQDLNDLPQRIERGEEGRAERLRLTIQPTAKALIEGMQILDTEISTFRAAAERQEAATRELRAEVSALRQEAASQREAMLVLQADMAAFRETSTPSTLSDLMVFLRADLAESRDQLSELLAASVELLTDLRESAPPGPTSHGERKWSAPKQPSASLPLAVAWRILAMNLQRRDPDTLHILDGYKQQAVDACPLGTNEDLILATAWQVLEENSRHADPAWVSQMQRVMGQAKAVLGLP